MTVMSEWLADCFTRARNQNSKKTTRKELTAKTIYRCESLITHFTPNSVKVSSVVQSSDAPDFALLHTGIVGRPYNIVCTTMMREIICETDGEQPLRILVQTSKAIITIIRSIFIFIIIMIITIL